MRLPVAAKIIGAIVIFLGMVGAWQMIECAMRNSAKMQEPSEGYWQTHPAYVYSIEPVKTRSISGNDAESYKPHPRGIRSWVSPDSLLAFLRNDPFSGGINYVGFSRTGKYLAIESTSGPMIIWDMQNKREISRFRATAGKDTDGLFWGPEDRFVTLGHSFGDTGPTFRVWSPLTGDVTARVPGTPLVSAMNRNGSQMISLIGDSAVGAKNAASHFRIYDTASWNYRDLKFPVNSGQPRCDQLGDLTIKSLFWPETDRLIEMGKAPLPCSLDLKAPPIRGGFIAEVNPSRFDAARLISTNTGGPQDALGNGQRLAQFRHGWLVGIIALHHGYVLDTNRMTLISPNHSDDQSGAGRSVLSKDGKYLYVTEVSGSRTGGRAHNDSYGCVQEVSTGKIVGKFPAGETYQSIDISPDGRFLAITSKSVVDIYRLK